MCINQKCVKWLKSEIALSKEGDSRIYYPSLMNTKITYIQFMTVIMGKDVLCDIRGIMNA